MEKIFCLIIILFGFLCVNTLAQEEYLTVPTDSKILVDGKEVDFTAYHINGYNYFKLRDLAMAFMDTDKAFNVSGNSSAVSLYTNDSNRYTPYKPLGNELSLGAANNEYAIKNMIQLILNDDYILKPGFYNIGDFNYVKLRDIALVLDFYVTWDASRDTVLIDTQKKYEPQPLQPVFPQEVYESHTPVFINEMPINTYTVGRDSIGYPEINSTTYSVYKKYGAFTSLIGTNYIIAEDLINYGFDIYKDETAKTIYITQNSDKKFGMMDGILVNRKTSDEKIFDLTSSEYTLEMDGEKVACYGVGSKTLISLESLLKYGELNTLRPGVSFDFLKNRLEQEFDSADAKQISESKFTNDRVQKLVTGLSTAYIYHFESFNSQVSNNLLNGICKFSIKGGSSGRSQYSFIGHVKNDCMDGEGHYTINIHDVGLGAPLRSHNDYEIGLFQAGKFVDGVIYRGGTTGGTGIVNNARRTEGAMYNGYRRECEYLADSDFRFGYRVVCEGEVQNGEYVGYYRQYDEDGTLVFEGQYSDYIRMQNT